MNICLLLTTKDSVMRASVLFLAIILTASVSAAEPDTRYLQSLGGTHYMPVTSEIVGRDFHVYVMLPDNYQGFLRDELMPLV